MTDLRSEQQPTRVEVIPDDALDAAAARYHFATAPIPACAWEDAPFERQLVCRTITKDILSAAQSVGVPAVPDDEEVDAAARALRKDITRYDDEGEHGWGTVPQHHDWWRLIARAALVAAYEVRAR